MAKKPAGLIYGVNDKPRLRTHLFGMASGRSRSVIHDLRGGEKHRARVDDLLARFEEVRRREKLDEIAAEMLRRYLDIDWHWTDDSPQCADGF
jgi:hypothetical protein